MIRLEGRFLYSVACRSFANMHRGQRDREREKEREREHEVIL